MLITIHRKLYNKRNREIICKVTSSSCYECISHKSIRTGYPAIRENGKMHKLSRWVYENFKGKIPKNLIVRHTCDNKLCVNKDHLILGSHQDNSNDAVIRNLFPKNEDHHNSKLTKKLVKQIKKALKSGLSQRNIAKEYNVSQVAISLINRGITWRNV